MIKRHLLLLGMLGVLSSCQTSHRRYAVEDVVDTTYVHKYGVEVPEKDWDKRGQHGQVVLKRKNGVVVSQNYVSGVLEGETTHTFPNSDQIEKVLLYHQDKLIAKTENYPSGLPKERREFNHDHTIVHTWYASSTPKSYERFEGDALIEGEYFTTDNKVETRVLEGEGERMNRDPFGQVLSKDSVEQGEVVLRTVYHQNGMPKSLIPYKGEVVEGLRHNFLPTGEPLSIEEWKNDQQHGITTLFENGEKIAEVPYEFGVKSGKEKRFKGENKVVQIISWKHGVQHGPSTSYAGKTKQTDWFYDGRQVSGQIFQKLVKVPIG